MTKTIYSITPMSRGDFSEAILKMVSNHNAGKANIDFEVMKGYCMGDYAQWTSIRNFPTFIEDKEAGIMEIHEGGKHTLTINEKIIEVLEETQNQGNAESSES